MRFAFGDFVLDTDTRQLLRAGRELALGPKGYELLVVLLRARPRALSRTKLRAALWPDSHVGQTSLHVLVSQLRSALGDDARESRWVRTVRDFGYAFQGEVLEHGGAGAGEDAPGQATLASARDCFLLVKGENVLGREDGLAVRLDAPGVSRRHARILLQEDGATLEDLGSKNGTFVEGARVASPRLLRDGDVVRLGVHVKLVFRHTPGEATRTERE
jgi:DNA-binding winged helix-turn-helix (wHTH) protein